LFLFTPTFLSSSLVYHCHHTSVVVYVCHCRQLYLVGSRQLLRPPLSLLARKECEVVVAPATTTARVLLPRPCYRCHRVLAARFVATAAWVAFPLYHYHCHRVIDAASLPLPSHRCYPCEVSTASMAPCHCTSLVVANCMRVAWAEYFLFVVIES